MLLRAYECISDLILSTSRRDPKQLILDAALSAFAELGFEHATTGA
jgi:hypothetical protein